MKKKFMSMIALLLVAVLVGVPLTGVETEAAASNDVRKRAVSLTGIMTIGSTEGIVTRQQFAKVLVNASSYKGNIYSVTNTALYSDVASNSEYAPYIKIAVEEGWMTGYLGGVFRPEQNITLQEAVMGVTALLGYQDNDFSGNRVEGRMALYYAKNLDENITKSAREELTKMDCINLMYNLLKADTKNGSMYGILFDCTLTSDGEINALALADDSVIGPVLVTKSLSNTLPFSVSQGTYYMDGQSCESSDISVGDVIYYNRSTKIVWAYSSTYVYSGTVDEILYSGIGTMTPSGVSIDGRTFALGTSDVVLAFSSYGEIGIEDEIVVIYEFDSTNQYGRKIVAYIKQ